MKPYLYAWGAAILFVAAVGLALPFLFSQADDLSVIGGIIILITTPFALFLIARLFVRDPQVRRATTYIKGKINE